MNFPTFTCASCVCIFAVPAAVTCRYQLSAAVQIIVWVQSICGLPEIGMRLYISVHEVEILSLGGNLFLTTDCPRRTLM